MLAKYDSLPIGGIKKMLGYYYFSSIYPFLKIIIGNEKIFDVGSIRYSTYSI